MTSQPPSQPIGYAYGVPGSQPQRPTSVTVLAIIGIVLASLGLLGGICGGISLLLLDLAAVADELTAPERVMFGSPVWKAYNLVSTGLYLLLSILLLMSSIGSLSLRPGSRRGMLLYAVLAIALAIIGIIMTLVVLLPILRPFIDSGDAAESRVAWRGMINSLLATLAGVIYPICVLIFFRRPHVIEAFEGPQGSYPSPYAPPTAGPQQQPPL